MFVFLPDEDPETFKYERQLTGHKVPVRSCAITRTKESTTKQADGSKDPSYVGMKQFAITGDQTGLMLLWDLDSGACLWRQQHSVGGSSVPTHSLGFSSCGLYPVPQPEQCESYFTSFRPVAIQLQRQRNVCVEFRQAVPHRPTPCNHAHYLRRSFNVSNKQFTSQMRSICCSCHRSDMG